MLGFESLRSLLVVQLKTFLKNLPFEILPLNRRSFHDERSAPVRTETKFSLCDGACSYTLTSQLLDHVPKQILP